MSDSDFLATQWWQTGVIYQVYPRSFQDTEAPNRAADGVGDLPGITARLNYLATLGVDALWISPFYPSPMADFGYDVANYTGVDPLFGTLADFDELLSQAHKRGLRVILDFVPNHTSDQHPWFLESRSSRDNPKRDWYLWHDAAQPGDDWQPAKYRVPNNWMSQFGGPAWTWDEPTQQFYLHSFLAQQPDLNWRSPEVRAAMYAAMRFWLDRGVDGFRMDVLWLLIKDAHFRNNPPNPAFEDAQHDHRRNLAIHNADQPETHQIVAEMRALLDTYGPTLPPPSLSFRSAAEESAVGPATNLSSDFAGKNLSSRPKSALHADGAERPATPLAPAPPPEPSAPTSNRVLIGEIYLPLPALVSYYGLPAQPGAPGPDFRTWDSSATPQLTGANLPFNFHLIQTQWTAAAIADCIRTYESLLPTGAWPNYVLGNHDQSRLATRIGPLQARAAAMLLLTLRGTPTLYYGDELGMVDVPIAPDQVRDPAEKNEPGKGRGRDPERSPMLWTPSPNAGFTTPDAKPWLPLQQDWPTANAATQSREPRSILTLYRKLLALRRQHDTLHAGAIADIAAEGNILRYRRVGLEDGHSTDFQILLNLGPDIATTQCAAGTIVLTTILDGEGSRTGAEDGSPAPVTLEAGEGLLIALD
jgi:alpha-glucosidase